MKKQRIIIIGAGAAGLSVAQQLQLSDYQTTLLEAQATIGGRVRLQQFAGLSLDSGASLLHDKHLCLYGEAKRAGLLEKPGKLGFIVNRRYMPAWRFALFHALPSISKSKRLIKAFYLNQEPQQTLEDLILSLRFNPVTANFMRQVLGAALGAGVDKVAAKLLCDSFKAAGMRPERDLINQSLSMPLSVLLMELFQQQVLTNHQVISVDYSQAEIEVRCLDGKVFYADKVVVTVPLGVLKKQSIQFKPSLPQAHQAAIDKLGMGQGGKFFLRFSKSFWKPGLKQLINTDQLCHFWIPNVGEPVIIGFYVDREQGLESAGRLDRMLDTLGGAFGCNAQVMLQQHHHEDWSANPHIGGLYSYDALGSEGARSILQQAVAGRLFFAGEAAIEGHFATVDGAIESGIRAAKQVMKTCIP